MDKKEKKKLYSRFIGGELSGQEFEHFGYLMAKGEFADLMPEIDDIAREYPISWTPAEHIGERIVSTKVIGRKRRRMIWNVAAVIVGFLIVFSSYRGYVNYTYYQKTQHYYTVKVPLGRTLEIRLTDGTQVKLAPGSTFKYPEAFGRLERRVYLMEGRGFFDIAKNRSKPFTVQSNTLATTALGTSFTVENYKKYSFEKVNLFSGKVRINQRANNTKVFLVPGEQYAYNDSTSKGLKTDFSNTGGISEIGLLNFRDTRLEEAFYAISSYYKIHIQFNPEAFTADMISGAFKNQSPAQILETMSHIYRFKVVQQNSENYLIIPMKH